MLAKESIAAILAADGSAKMATMSVETMVELAAIARRRGARLEIVGTSMVEISGGR